MISLLTGTTGDLDGIKSAIKLERYLSLKDLLCQEEEIIIKVEAPEGAQAIKAIRHLDNQPIVENPIMVSRQAESVPSRRKNNRINPVTEIRVWKRKEGRVQKTNNWKLFSKGQLYFLP